VNFMIILPYLTHYYFYPLLVNRLSCKDTAVELDLVIGKLDRLFNFSLKYDGLSLVRRC
jgi:hypothetical protein